MATKRPGPYVGLSAHYADDEKIMAAGEDAELLYVRMLAYAARVPMTEGWISEAVLKSRLGVTARDSGNGTGNVPGTDPLSRAEKLLEVGLIEREGSGWRISSWLKWNRSIEEMGKTRESDRKRKTRPDQQVSGNDTGTGTGTGTGTQTGNGTGKVSASGNNDQDQDQDQDQDHSRKRATQLPSSWKPTTEHQERAKGSGLDIDREVVKFKAHAEEKGRTAKSWNAAFTRWLINAAEYAQRDGSNVRPLNPGAQLTDTQRDRIANPWKYQ